MGADTSLAAIGKAIKCGARHEFVAAGVVTSTGTLKHQIWNFSPNKALPSFLPLPLSLPLSRCFAFALSLSLSLSLSHAVLPLPSEEPEVASFCPSFFLSSDSVELSHEPRSLSERERPRERRGEKRGERQRKRGRERKRERRGRGGGWGGGREGDQIGVGGSYTPPEGLTPLKKHKITNCTACQQKPRITLTQSQTCMKSETQTQTHALMIASP